MTLADKVVTNLPLQRLWNLAEEMNLQRSAYLDKEGIQEILRRGPVHFVVADVGDKLKWIDPSDCYIFWKSEVVAHLSKEGDKIYLDDFPNAYAYLASEWKGDTRSPIILLEKFH